MNNFEWKVRIYDKDTVKLIKTIDGLTYKAASILHEEYTKAGYYVCSGNWTDK